MNIVNAAWYQRTEWPENTVYIGRNNTILQRSGGTGPNIFGNKFPVALCGNLSPSGDGLRPCIEADFGHNMLKMLNPDYVASIHALTGKNLACHCAPKPCHGHNLKMACESTQPDAKPFPTPTTGDLVKLLNVFVAQSALWQHHPMRDALRTLTKSMYEHDNVQYTNNTFVAQSPTAKPSESSINASANIGNIITHSNLSSAQITHVAQACIAVQASTERPPHMQTAQTSLPIHTAPKKQQDRGADIF